MEKIRQAIDTRLAGQHLPETVYDALCARPARRSRVRRAAALLAAVCVLGGATALAAAKEATAAITATFTISEEPVLGMPLLSSEVFVTVLEDASSSSTITSVSKSSSVSETT